MSLSSSRTKLVTGIKELHARWDRVRHHWDDEVAKSFEAEYISTLDGKVRSGVSAIEDMHELISRARRECG